MIPDYDAVVVDEAHEVVSRVTQAATDELFAAEVDRAARRSRRWVERGRPRVVCRRRPRRRRRRARGGDRCVRARPVRHGPRDPGRRAGARAGRGAGLPVGVPEGGRATPTPAAPRRAAPVQEVFATVERMAAGSEADVLWLTEGGDRLPPRLCVAPLEVWGPMRDKLLTDKTVVMTSATLMLGGDFDALATSVGLKPAERVDVVVGATVPMTDKADEADEPDARAPDVLPWVGLDVGSPFDYGRQAILYVARHLPPPGRDGLGKAQLDEIVSLVDAAEGRTLGLFSSRRAAETAAEEVRERLPHLTTLAQGEAQLPGAGPAVRRRPPHLPVRHPQPLAGPRRPRRHLPAGDDRPDPVPAARRPADERAPARGRPRGSQRLHAGRRHPRRPAAGPGRGSPDPYDVRQRRRRGPRPAAGHGALRQLPQGEPAADVDDVRRRPGARRPSPAWRQGEG